MLRVLGIGSPFGDDRLGWEVIDLLQQNASINRYIPHYLQLVSSDRPGLHLLELMRGATTVFLVDAVNVGAAVGTLHYFVQEEIEVLDDALSTHAIGIAEAIRMGAVLNDLPPNISLYGLEIGEVQIQPRLSGPIRQAIDVLSERLVRDILLLLSRHTLSG